MQIWEHFYPHRQVFVLKLFDATGVPAPGTVYKYLLNTIEISPLCFHLDTRRLSFDAKLKPDTQTIWKVTIIRKGKVSPICQGPLELHQCLPAFKITVGTVQAADILLWLGQRIQEWKASEYALMQCTYEKYADEWYNDSTFLGEGWEGRNTIFEWWCFAGLKINKEK